MAYIVNISTVIVKAIKSRLQHLIALFFKGINALLDG